MKQAGSREERGFERRFEGGSGYRVAYGQRELVPVRRSLVRKSCIYFATEKSTYSAFVGSMELLLGFCPDPSLFISTANNQMQSLYIINIWLDHQVINKGSYPFQTRKTNKMIVCVLHKIQHFSLQ